MVSRALFVVCFANFALYLLGKTRYLVALLYILEQFAHNINQQPNLERQSRIMVCAASNKAVSVVAESYLTNQERSLPIPGNVMDVINSVLIGVEDKISSLSMDNSVIRADPYAPAGLELLQLINIRVMILCSEMKKHDCPSLDDYNWRELIPVSFLKLTATVLTPKCSMDLLVYQYSANVHKYLLALNVILDTCKNSVSNTNKIQITKFCDNDSPDTSSQAMLLSLYITVRCLLSVIVTDYLSIQRKLKTSFGRYYMQFE